MKNNQNIFMLKPKKICFKTNYIEITDLGRKQYQIFYKDLILASLQIFDDKSGACYEPEITDITKDLEGDLLLYDCRHICWQIRLEGIGKTAGALLPELSVHAPHILIGKQTWIDIENEKDFEEIGNMVNLMSRC